MVLLIGAYPPPYGGNSIHVQRLKQLCDSKGIECIVLSLYGNTHKSDEKDVVRITGNRIFKVLRLIARIRKFRGPKHSIVHIHVTAVENFQFAGIPILYACKSFQKVITIHGGNFVEDYDESNFLRKRLTRYLLRKFEKIITVNDDQRDLLTNEFGINARKIITVPAFLPPTSNGNFRFRENTDLIRVKEFKSRFDILGLAAGYILRFYGFHDILDSLRLVSKHGIKFGLIFVFYTEVDTKYESELMGRINGNPNILILKNLKPELFIEVLKHCDVFIRPTYFDGDSVALREAAYLQKQIVASDSVKRPSGCVLFKTGSPDDLAKKIVDITNNKNLGVVPDAGVDNGERIVSIYKKFSAKP